ncbi:MAG: UDP-3-O-acyl-N-acetylglucosamine deacetylase, partial [Candidatus Caenarcaniphilales bacterium]|nr:UDP-3-O-acyl-N-acetylglucosamine deacetylase [Candidatus Caenarcaniphilales bacterium]
NLYFTIEAFNFSRNFNQFMEASIIKFSAEGSISKKQINLEFRPSNKKGIYFTFPDGSFIEASVKNLSSATRNTVLGSGKNLICFVEHLLCAINLLQIPSLEIFIDGQEIPLLDGSAKPWIDLLKKWPEKNTELTQIELNEVKASLSKDTNKDERTVLAYPNKEFKMTYIFKSPINGEQSWVSWSLNDGIDKLARARTFAPKEENQAMGLIGKWLSYDMNGYDLPLYEKDEPALHKLLDLFGDLSLSGANPLGIKAHFISFQGGHALNTQMARILSKSFV